MTIRTSTNGQVELVNHMNRVVKKQSFPKLEQVVQGEGFFVVQQKGGWIEVYDQNFNLLSSEVFLNVKRVHAAQDITICYESGWREIYCKEFNMKSMNFIA